MTFKSEEFSPRLMAIIFLFRVYGVIDEKDFDKRLGFDWTWEHYCKVLRELQVLGAIDEDNNLTPGSKVVLMELSKLYGRLEYGKEWRLEGW
jgi:hypothetical protein